jgi:hypothetical protein
MKKWYESKTVLFNLALIGIGIIDVLEEYILDVRGVMGEYGSEAVIVIGIVGVVLRTITSSGIKLDK